MKISFKKKIRLLVTSNKVTTFIAKFLFMLSDFKIGDIVCLTFDNRKRFLVESNVIIYGKIQLAYFNESGIVICEIEPKYLMLAPKQD